MHDRIERTLTGASRSTGVVAFGLLLLMVLGVLWRLAPPPLRPASGASGEFEVERVQASLGRLLPHDLPHPTGSSAQREFRSRLVAELAAVGVAAEQQIGVVCASFCAEVSNVVARVAGLDGGSAQIGVVAHYDTAGASPGAADDGQGVASLIEMARAYRERPSAAGVAFIFMDGEELGSLGARLFVREHPLATSLRVVINLEARGNRGASFMFESSPGDHWLIDSFAASAERPLASSAFAGIYRALPNYTDLSAFLAHGAQGLNFAFLQGYESYHTAWDTPDRLSWRSVRQQGRNALATLRRVADGGIQAPGDDAIFFDVFGAFVARWPSRIMIWLLSASLALHVTALLRDVRRQPAHARALAGAAGRTLLGWVVTTSLAAGLGWLLQVLGALPFAFVARPAPLLAASIVLSFGGSSIALARNPRDPCHLALWDVAWLWWAALSALLLVLMPGASYLTLLPGLVTAGLRFWLDPRGWTPARSACLIVPAVVAAAVWLPILSMLPDLVGFASLAVYGLAFGLFLMVWAPLFGGWLGSRRTTAYVLAGGVALAGCQLLIEPYGPDTAQRLSLGLSFDPAGNGRWLADISFGPLPEPLAGTATWKAGAPHPWPSPGRPRVAESPASLPPPPGPRLTIERPTPQHVRLQAIPEESAWALRFHIPAGSVVQSGTWRGQKLEIRQEGEWQSISIIPGSLRDVSIDLSFAGAPPPAIEVSQLTLGLPNEASPLIAARNGHGVASHFGDLTLVSARAALPAAAASVGLLGRATDRD